MDFNKTLTGLKDKLDLAKLAEPLAAKFGKKAVKRLPDEFRGVLGHATSKAKGKIPSDDIWLSVERSIPFEFREVHIIVREYWKAAPAEKGRIFARLCDYLNEIAPKGCQFTRRYGIWGFWEKDIY